MISERGEIKNMKTLPGDLIGHLVIRWTGITTEDNKKYNHGIRQKSVFYVDYTAGSVTEIFCWEVAEAVRV